MLSPGLLTFAALDVDGPCVSYAYLLSSFISSYAALLCPTLRSSAYTLQLCPVSVSFIYPTRSGARRRGCWVSSSPCRGVGAQPLRCHGGPPLCRAVQRGGLAKDGYGLRRGR